MQKIGILFMAVMSVLISFECQSFQGIKRENIYIRDNGACVDHEQKNTDEYNEEDDILQQYEQHVCDQVVPPKISARMAFCTELGGYMLIKFITAREAVRRYFVSFKTAINKMVKSIII